MPPQDGASQGPQENPIMTAYNGWASTKPFVTRSMCILQVVLFLLGMFVDLDLALNNSLHYTIYSLEVYRIFTASLWCTSFITLIFGVMVLSQMGPKMEYSLGSARLLALMAILDVAANSAFLLFGLLSTALGNRAAELSAAQGLWNLLMPLIVVDCMQMPDFPRKLFFFPCEIPSKYYPLALFALFSIMGGVRVDMALALATGYAFAFGKLDCLKPSISRVQGWENGCLRNFTSRQGYITATGTQQEPWQPVNNPAGRTQGDGGESGSGGSAWVSRNSGPVTAPSVVNKKPAASAFTGSGQTLGGGSTSRTSVVTSALGRGSNTDVAAAARAARLAALEARGAAASSPSSAAAGGGANGGTGRGGGAAGVGATSSLLSNTDHEVMMLQDMGYSADDAREALTHTEGDINAAVAYLAESRSA
ncbi:hypothetical protein JKP88DRAFT_207921 [Tribonema minus]|uniref:UBA domain-containing protein n=1 Tax=Tribonema minus TaxID=303371 RepID=A0A835Z2V1_9STRA|nr:hypothetical protein JKP88DRAFT_207921 [Tribonema minus]